MIKKYKLHDLANQGFVYTETQKGVYVIPQAGNIYNDKLKQYLAKFCYAPVHITPGLWQH